MPPKSNEEYLTNLREARRGKARELTTEELRAQREQRNARDRALRQRRLQSAQPSSSATLLSQTPSGSSISNPFAPTSTIADVSSTPSASSPSVSGLTSATVISPAWEVRGSSSRLQPTPPDTLNRPTHSSPAQNVTEPADDSSTDSGEDSQPTSDRTWRSEPCQHCGALLLQSEPLSFCCKNGTKALPPLPALPPFLNSIVGHPHAGSRSLSLNNAVHFAAQGYHGDRIQFGQGVPAVALQGTIYHRLLPADQDRSPLNLFFHNRRAQETLGGADMPRHWVRSLRNELELFNPLVGLFNMLMTEADGVTPATLEIQQ
ncbi:unnamed protein product, partial [Tilletia caries]